MAKIENIEKFLTEDEQILMHARIHEIVFAGPIFLTLIAFLAGAFFHPLMGFVIMLLALYPWYNAIIYYKMTNLILTNKKVMSREGFLSRDWIRMDFDRIENAYLEEPIIGRRLGYSTVIVSGVGSGSVAVARVQDGDKFVEALEKQLAQHRDRRG